MLAREWQLEQDLKAEALKQPRPDAAAPSMTRCDNVYASVKAHREGISHRLLYRAHRGLGLREFEEVIRALEGQGHMHRAKVRASHGPRATVYRPGSARAQA